jgi:hypothetical protein
VSRRAAPTQCDTGLAKLMPHGSPTWPRKDDARSSRRFQRPSGNARGKVKLETQRPGLAAEASGGMGVTGRAQPPHRAVGHAPFGVVHRILHRPES